MLLACSGDTGSAGDAGSVAAGQGGARAARSTAGGGASAQACDNATHQLFPPAAVWNTKIVAGPDSESDTIVRALALKHTSSSRFQIDFSIHVLHADAAVQPRAFVPNDDFYETECDPAPVPVPAGGALEGEDDYRCSSDGDCHLIVVQPSRCRLYEIWRADIQGDRFSGGCQAIWNLAAVPPATLRGDQCTSADAAGLPIAPLLFNADEVAAGEIPHALRFIMPNALIRNATYVQPGTHATRAASGGLDSLPYAARMRLKPSTDLSSLSAPAKVVARALIDYGMYLADGGSVTFTAQSDRGTVHRWDEVGLDPHALKSLSWSDFEMVEAGPRHSWTGDCERTPIVD
jgi:serine/threonine-protein kinase